MPKLGRTLKRAAALPGALAASLMSAFARSIVGVNTTGVPVTEQTALCLSAFYCGVNAISTDLASLPLRLVRVADDGSESSVLDHAASTLFTRSPDGGRSTPMRWRQSIVSHALTFGSGFAEVVASGDGSRTYAYLLDPATTRSDPTAKDVKYFVNGVSVDKERIIHLAGLGYNGIDGYQLVRAANQSIGLGLVAERFGGSFLGKGSHVAGFIKSPADLTEDAAKELLDNFHGRHSGPDKAGTVGILPPGYDFVVGQTNKPSDAQLTDLRAFQVLEMARWLRMSPHKLGDMSKASYASIEASNLEYVMMTLLPWAIAFEQALNLRLLSDADAAAGLMFKHDFKALMRADAPGRAAIYRVLFACGAITPNEIRAGEGLPPRKDDAANALYAPMNMQGSNAFAAADPSSPPLNDDKANP